MESTSHRLQEEQKKQDEIRRQIALLQAQLVQLPEEQRPVEGVKRKQEHANNATSRSSTSVLAPATPSPKKKRKLEIARDVSKHTERPNAAPSVPSKKPTILNKGQVADTNVPAPSTFLNRLAALANDEPSHDAEEKKDKPSRSASFTDAAPSIQHDHSRPKRNEDLTIVEDMEPGPYEHSPPLDDANFDRLEPHSGIRLLSRAVPHEDICEYMHGRFFLSPSRLYSCVRLSADKQSYDVPVSGDWVTIAVVAEIGEVKYTRAPVSLERDEDEKKKSGNKNKPGGKGKERQQDDEENGAKGGGKRYVNVRLVDFGGRSKGSETGGANIIRGDACLSMLLFESDMFEWLEPGDEEQQGKPKKKKVKVYKGGSKGAFESMHKLRHGDVVALLNPRVLKPFQRNSTSAIPGNSSSANMLAVSPESAGTILLVGSSRDFGRCNARRRDGQQCGSWCDTRVSEVCDWHMQRAVESRRAGRAEFSAGTTGMSTSAAARKGRKRAEEFDPEKQWGLVPSGTSNGATYVLSGHIISSTQSSDIFVGEKMGREAQARAQRKAAGQDVEKVLKQLMERDKDGMRSVFRAREVGDAMAKEGKTRKQSGKEKKKKSTKEKEEPGVQEPPVSEIKMRKSLGYSAHVIKGIGFDPVALAASLAGVKKNVETDFMDDKLQTLARLREAKKERGFNLKPRAGERVRSGVVVPDNDKNTEKADEGMVDLDDL